MTSFDIIVVGAGGSGAALAARLSEDADRSVLLLEAGPVPGSTAQFPQELLDAGTLRGADPRHPDNWSFPAHLTADRPYSIARGRIAGGSTTINGAYFIRATDDDFARWSASGCRDWALPEVLPALRRLESDTQYGPSSRHGGQGPMPVTRHPPAPAVSAFHAAAIELGYPEEPDKNGGGSSGVGPVPTNVVDGVRINTALAYLLPARHRANLTLQGGCMVRRIVSDGSTAVGVEVAHDGVTETIGAREIVLSAGAMQSPHLLMLSGIGPRAALEAQGIRVLVDAPTVGQGFSDHPQITLEWYPASGIVDLGGPVLGEVLNVVENGAQIEVLQMLKPTEYLLTGSVPPTAPLSFLVALQNAQSRGEITLASSDPTVPPTIDYHYLASETDRRRMRAAVQLGVRMLQTAAFAPLVERRGAPEDATVDDDAALDAWIRDHLGTSIHACGSVAFGPGDSAVDQYGRVRGVSGLRVADTSILPTVPTRGPAATAVLVGERVSDFIRRGD